MAYHSIGDVITAIDKIVTHCFDMENRSGYFATLYKRMTMAVAEGITNNKFEDGSRMEKLDIVFAQRYLSACESYSAREDCSQSWKYAFDECGNKKLTVIQQLVLGINTHINLDLAIAAAEIAPGETIHDLEKDFNRINDVIAGLIDDMQQCLEEVWFPMRWLKRIANGRQDAVLNFSIGIARKTAWANAVLLANLTGHEKEKHINEMDKLVHGLGNKISSPGFWPGLLMRIIRFTEYDDVKRTIHLLNTTVV